MSERRLRAEAQADPDVLALQRMKQVIWAAFFFALAIFAKFPGLDLLISARYFNLDEGFFHRYNPVVRALYDYTPILGRILVISLAIYALIAPWVARYFERQNQPSLAMRAKGSWRRIATIAVVCGLIGPGLIIEGYFKNQQGRPRPVQVEAFDGPEVYQGPFMQGDNPGKHRSFTSSHAATGFWLMSLGLTCGPVWRRRWLLIGIVSGAAIGFGRILQGGHFFSDVLFSFFFVWISCELVAWWDQRRQRHA